MKKLFFLIAVLLFFTCSSQSWSWAVAYNGQYFRDGNSVGVDSIGNVYVTGSYYYLTGGGGSFYYPMFYKYSSSGVLLITDTLISKANQSITDKSGNTYITATGSFQKYGPNGQLVWNIPCGTYNLNSLSFDATGNIVVAGSVNTGSSNVGVLMQFNSAGNQLWSNVGNLPGITQIAIDNQNNIYAIGSCSPDSATGNRSFLSKITNSGVVTYTKVISHYAKDLTIDNENNIYVVGEIMLQPTTINGTVYTSPNGGYDRIHLIKYDNLGNFQWLKLLKGSLLSTKGRSLIHDDNNTIYLTGTFAALQIDSINYSSNAQDVFILKLDKFGNILNAKRSLFTGQQSGGVTPMGICMNTAKDIFITGQISSSHYFDNSLTVASYYPDIIVAKLSSPIITSTKSIKKNNEFFSVTPNPSNGIFNISVSSLPCTIEILDLMGKKCYRQYLHENATRIDLTQFPAGSYIFRCYNDYFIEAKKIILE